MRGPWVRQNVARRHRGYGCPSGANNHETRPSFATDAAVPEHWDCPRCGFPAGRDEANPPGPPRSEPYKTHLAYVKERRTDSDGAAILEEALNRIRRA